MSKSAQKRMSAMNAHTVDAFILFLVDPVLKVLLLLFHVAGKTWFSFRVFLFDCFWWFF